ncbi:hypothetical protein K505DRAFT_355620 [Melanomma pulvis-pyrius CBS 109.77]|uniref:Uncharacterized protein n=1 Tax=Melanomma pulvis-pyrius CBS 109.77 TaxID=1314802 RepID=A0A6A6XW93_9PLEO|nr:hypothetical protein K505DRAFT_355620 [Melanomma pulvis-pyrius CBS 109.77]
MSKAAGDFVLKAKSLSNSASKFTPAAVEGHRILPTRVNDAKFQFRIDAGYYDPTTKKLNVNLQINSEAKNQALRNWARKHSTDDKLATEAFDTAAEDKTEEYNRVVESLGEQAKRKLG